MSRNETIYLKYTSKNQPITYNQFIKLACVALIGALLLSHAIDFILNYYKL